MTFFYGIAVFLFGLIIGSFLNCIIYRLHAVEITHDRELSRQKLKRSFCPQCHHVLTWYCLIPVFSYIFLRGKCRYCNKRISIQYPLVELATGFLFLIFYFLFFIHFLFLIFYLVISCFLIVIFVYDLKHYIIPDKVVYPAIIIAGIFNFQFFNFLSFLSAAIGAAGFFAIIFFVSRGKAIGFGDVKLGFLMGLLLGWPNILVALFTAFTTGAVVGIGLIVKRRKTLKSEVPFGPFLVAGTFIALFFGQKVINWYLNFFMIK